MENNIVEEKTVGLSAPWVTFYREIQALFAKDPEIDVKYDEDNTKINIYVSNSRKADALAKLLPESRTFGNVTVEVNIIPGNEEENIRDTLRDAFYGNPVLSYITPARLPGGNIVSFVVFRNEVVQFFNDDMSDLYGNKSTLYQEIAKDLFGSLDQVYFNTNIEGNPDHPITGENAQ